MNAAIPGTSPVVLTGDRPTGPLHLGHFAGSLKQRVSMQRQGFRCFVMIADMQAYTDNAENTRKVADAIPHLVADYIGVGIDPGKTSVFLQSAVPELAELSMIYMNLVTVSRLERNPTIREEIRQRGFDRDIPAGFLCYPVSQAADITGFRATHVPVGDDQLPMLELAQEIARRVNRIAERPVLPEPSAVLSKVTRLPGIDGKAKASKSLGNAIFLSDSPETLKEKVMSMYTDPDHLKISDPGKIEGNVVFSYLDAFDPDAVEVALLKERYRAGGLGDVALKRRLAGVLEETVGPIRFRRGRAFEDREYLLEVLRQGSDVARQEAAATLRSVKEGLGILSL